ncbi:MAG: hypothetical protein EXX96DRAFT_126320 [Benjaminiella poitrasii]|nr:MAG: hypothetical protein EXX96DRAFT_126320 [Benjaminiella poitrasii]
MFNGLRSEHDAWTTCIKVILGLLEDSLLKGALPSTKIKFNEENREWLKFNESTDTLSAPDSPSSYNLKRKRSFSNSAQDRKLQKLSSSLANDIARSLSVSLDDIDMTTTSPLPAQPFNIYTKPVNEENPMPALRRISMSGTLNPTSASSLEQWLELQAQKNHMPFIEYKHRFNDKQKELRQELDLLQKPDQHFEALRDHLSKVLRLANELSGDHTLPFIEVFPEWTIYENKINKLASYIQSVEDMSYSVNSTIPQSDDLSKDIKRLQGLLESKMALYGDALIQNGLEWKAMGMPVNDSLLVATKEWLHNLCVGLLDVLDTECKKAQELVNNMEELIHLPMGENLMECILTGLEFIAEASSFIGFTSHKLAYDCCVLAAIYEQWISENLEHMNDGSDMVKKTPKRIDIRFMQLMDNATRVLSSLYILEELEIRHKDILHLSSSVAAVENLTSVLVELTVTAISIIETDQKNASKVTGNIMTNPQTTFIYMGESLLSFADKIVYLAGREYQDGHRIQVSIFNQVYINSYDCTQ